LFSVLGGLVGAVAGGAIGAGLGIWAGKAFPRPGATGKSRLPALLGAVLAVVGALGLSAVLRPSLERRLEDNPTLAVLKQYYPDKYQQVIAAARSGPTGTAALHNAVAPIIGQTVHEHARQIDDDSAHRMFSLLVAESRLTRDRAPGACIGMLAGGTSQVDISSLMTPQMKRAEVENTAAVLKQIATHPAQPAQPLDHAEIKAMAETALAKLSPADQAMVNDLMSQSRGPSSIAEARAMCSFDIEMFQTALDGPPGRIRSLIAVG
jgi:hypothetical protein